MKYTVRFLRYIVGLGTILFFLGLGMQYAHATNGAYGNGAYGNCAYGSCSITLGTSSAVSLNVTPSSGATCTVSDDTVGVLTDSSSGYTLSLNDSDTNNSMVGSTTSVLAVSGSQASPVVLTTGHWGYRVDSVGGFGAGPTSSSTNASPPSLAFALVPISSASPDTLVSSTSAADPMVNTHVWYGACVDSSFPTSTYSDSVTYTAVIN